MRKIPVHYGFIKDVKVTFLNFAILRRLATVMDISFIRKTISEHIFFLINFFSDLGKSRFWRYVWVFFLAYMMATAAILRADVQYGDDVGRSAFGYRDWRSWSRYFSEYFSIFIYGNTYLTDMSPMTQLICLFFVALASAVIVCVFTDKYKFQFMNVIAVLPLSIFPYFLECFAFRYDSPYMGLSVLASVFPFLFLEKSRFYFGLCSVVSLLVMCMTYQASSGIYLVMLLFWSLKRYLFSEEVKYRELLSTVFWGGLFWGGTLGVYKFFFVHETANLGYGVSTAIAQNNLYQTGIQNVSTYIRYIRADFPVVWECGIALILLLCFLNIIVKTKRNQLVTTIVTGFVLGGSFVISDGAYLALQKPLFFPRAMYGFGAWLSLLFLFGVSSWPKNLVLKAVVIFLVLWFIGYANLYGNALAEQNRYEAFRIQLILNDINRVASSKEKITIIGKRAWSPAVKKWATEYPILLREIKPQLGSTYWWLEGYFRYSFNLPNFKVVKDAGKKYSKAKLKTLDIILDGRYHTIYRDGEYIVVKLK